MNHEKSRWQEPVYADAPPAYDDVASSSQNFAYAATRPSIGLPYQSNRDVNTAEERYRLPQANPAWAETQAPVARHVQHSPETWHAQQNHEAWHANQASEAWHAPQSSFPGSRKQSPGQGFLPIVIPQTTKAFGTAFASPFIRAYAPSLMIPGSHRQSKPIDAPTFLAFLDGLNEAFIGSPAFQALGLVGTGLSIAPLATLQIVGGSLSAAAGLGSAATSYARTLAYVKAANERLFRPAGLKLAIKNTRDMMTIVGVHGEQLHLPPLDMTNPANRNFTFHVDAGASPDDPRIRRLRALGDKVAPLSFDVPAPVAPDSVFKKMGDWQAHHAAKKQQEKMLKEREKAARHNHHHSGDRDMRKTEKEIAKLEREIEKVEEKAIRDMHEKGHRHGGREAAKIDRERSWELAKLEKEMEKLLREAPQQHGNGSGKGVDKAEKKEQEAAQKIRWLVITEDDGYVMKDEEAVLPEN